MSEELTLMTDREIQQFIVNGYTIRSADLGEAFHAGLRAKLDAVLDAEGNLGNNILPRVPEIAQVFDHPDVRGALVSLLGPDYVLNPHRHCHVNAAGSKGQAWHKDCYVYDHNLRHPRFDWVLAFYYPQETTGDMGPSAIVPGTQYFKSISSPDASESTEEELRICGPAGTVALIHFDAWHRATENTSARDRYMLKFQFARMSRRDDPSWEHQSKVWSPGIPEPQQTVARDVWEWMCGSSSGSVHANHESILAEGDEGARLDSAYRFVENGNGSAETLAELARSQSRDTILDTEAKPPDNLHGTNPTPGTAALGLSHGGPGAVRATLPLLEDECWWVRAVAANVLYRIGDDSAVTRLVEQAEDDHWWVRRNVLEALGEVGDTGEALSALNDGLIDGDYRVRRSACIGLAKRRAGDTDSSDALGRILEDENRYNRFYAALALSRMSDESARHRAMNSLFTARWCPITTKDDRY